VTVLIKVLSLRARGWDSVSALRMLKSSQMRVYVAFAKKLKKKINVQLLWLQKVNYKRWKIPVIIISVIIAVSLISLLVVVPLVFGEEFVSFSSELEYFLEAHPSLEISEVVYPDGRVVPVTWPVSWIGLTVNVTNSYVVPVEVSYNGFEFVWLIYNQTVADPTDVVGNKDYLVWGAFRTAYGLHGYDTYGFYVGPTFWTNKTGYESAYDYYAAHKDLSNYTKTISPGTHRHYLVFHLNTESYWSGQNYKTYDGKYQPVPPGTYHIYVIAYGKVNDPINITVTSVLWPH